MRISANIGASGRDERALRPEPRPELVDALTSTLFPRAVVEERLRAFAEVPWGPYFVDSLGVGARARALGAAVRAESAERARAAARLLFAEVDWESVASWDPAEQRRDFYLLADGPPYVLGRTTLLQVSHELLLHFLRAAGAPDAGLADDLVGYLDFGDEAAGARLEARYAGAALEGLRRSLSSAPHVNGRAVRLQLAPCEGDPAAEIRALADCFGYHGMIPAGVARIAARHGLGPVHPGANGAIGGRGDLYAEEGRPLVDVAFRLDPRLLGEIGPRIAREPSIAPALRSSAFDGLPWEDDREVVGAGGETFEARRVGAFVLLRSVKGKRCTTTAKSMKDAGAAAKEVERKLTAASKKLGQAAGPRGGAAGPGAGQALFEAARSGRRPAVRALLGAGVSPMAYVEGDGWTALHYAAREDPEIVRMLVEHGAECDRKTNGGVTPLSIAIDETGQPFRLEIARHLLDAGAQGDARDGLTALHRAAARGLVEIVELLLAYGHDADARAGQGRYAGKTPLDLARAGEHVATIYALERRA